MFCFDASNACCAWRTRGRDTIYNGNKKNRKKKRAQARCIKSMLKISRSDIKIYFLKRLLCNNAWARPFWTCGRHSFQFDRLTSFFFFVIYCSFQKERLIPRISLYCSNAKEVNCNIRNARFRIDGNGLQFSEPRASAILSSRQSYRTKQLSFGSFTIYSRAFKVPSESKSIFP